MPSRRIVNRYRACFSQHSFQEAVLLSVIAFCASVAVIYYAIGYTTQVASNAVTDIVLSNVPVFDVDGILAYGAALVILFILALILIEPKRIPFTLYSLAVFLFIRAGFISLTHVGPFPTRAPIDFSTNVGQFLGKLFISGDDFFFSAHVGITFLMALIFWPIKPLRYIFLATSIFFGVTVLFGHIHYSIDVAGAFFITYTIYCIVVAFFPRERSWFLQSNT